MRVNHAGAVVLFFCATLYASALRPCAPPKLCHKAPAALPAEGVGALPADRGLCARPPPRPHHHRARHLVPGRGARTVRSQDRGLPAVILGASLLLCSPLPAAPVGLPLASSSQAVLHEPALEVLEFDEDLAMLSRKMFDTMYREGGIGLAAPQIGIDQSIFVYNIFGQPLQLAATEHVLINPRILQSSEWSWTSPEGCLSLPDSRGPVTRPISVEVAAFDVQGQSITRTFTGVEARVVLHEIDHLNGVLFTESGWEWQNLIGSIICYALLLVGSAALAKAADGAEDITPR